MEILMTVQGMREYREEMMTLYKKYKRGEVHAERKIKRFRKNPRFAKVLNYWNGFRMGQRCAAFDIEMRLRNLKLWEGK